MRQPVSVVIPAFNEAKGVGAVVRGVGDVLTRAGVEHEVIVVDDGSTDATAKAAEAASATVLCHRANRGYGAALKTGILAAKHATVCILDADGTYPLEAIPDLLAAKERADMVVGARTGKAVHIPLVRRPAKWVLNKLANYVTQTRIPDLNSGLRVFDRNIALQYFNILSDQFSFTTTITMAMLCDKYAVKYVPIDYRRRVGKSKIVPWDAAAFTVLILRVAMLFRPLRVFLPVAFLSLVYAVVKASWDLLITGDRMISTTAAVAALSALHLTLIGMLGDAVATRLRHMNGILYGAQPHHAPGPEFLRPTRFDDERVA
jgi:glycosyltransferase involved in cell wall biosynthesis